MSDALVEAAKKAIDAVFGDRLCPRSQTIERLEELQDHAQSSIDALKDDIRREEQGE
jgi:hypothetical protein